MSLISLIVVLVIVGLALWLVGYIPMDPTIKKILQVVVIVFVVLWLLSVLLGGFGSLGTIRIGR